MASDTDHQTSPLNNDHHRDHDRGSSRLAAEEVLTVSLHNNSPKRAEEEFQVNKDDALIDHITSDPTTSSTIAANSTSPMTELTFRDAIAGEDEGAIGIDMRPQQQKPVDESRKLFQRLWTDEDEIELLRGFLEYTNQRGASSQHHYDTTLFYDQIKSKLQLEFNKNQLVEKLRRLKKKYRNILNRISAGKDVSFKSPHDQATFDISSKIWSPNVGGGGGLDDEQPAININLSPNPNYSFGNANSGNQNYNQNDSMVDERNAIKSRKRLRMKVEENKDFDERVVMANSGAAPGPSSRLGPLPNAIEETVKSCLSPMFKEIMDTAANGSCGGQWFGLGGIEVMSPLRLSFGNSGIMMDEKWRRQQILELELYSRRLELVQDEIRMQLQELRSSGS
ncbi:hypothetical protein QQ045_022627 [Rhodiola kirilowii]